MASLDSLPADQRAVLSLVLGRGRSYDEIARLLSIDPAAVRERALAASDSLGPQTRVPAERRALITDYLLGQLPAGVAEETRVRLAESASERGWARVLSSELAPLASGRLPDISLERSAARLAAPAADASSQAPVAAPPPRLEPEPEPKRDDDQFGPKPAKGRRTSRRGGVLLLGGAVIALIAVLVVLVVVVLGSGGSTSHQSSHTSSVASASSTNPKTTATTTTASTSSGSAQVVAQINLAPPPNSASKAAGIAEVLKEGATDGIAIVAQKVAPNTTQPANAYAVWLYNSPTDAHILGFVNPGVSSTGRLSTAGGLPSNAAHFQQLIVTLETQASPKTPGTIILQGALKGL